MLLFRPVPQLAPRTRPVVTRLHSVSPNGNVAKFEERRQMGQDVAAAFHPPAHPQVAHPPPALPALTLPDVRCERRGRSWVREPQKLSDTLSTQPTPAPPPQMNQSAFDEIWMPYRAKLAETLSIASVIGYFRSPDKQRFFEEYAEKMSRVFGARLPSDVYRWLLFRIQDEAKMVWKLRLSSLSKQQRDEISRQTRLDGQWFGIDVGRNGLCGWCGELMCLCLFCPACGDLEQVRRPGEAAENARHGYCERCWGTGPGWEHPHTYDEWLAQERRPEVRALRVLQERYRFWTDMETTRFTDLTARLLECGSTGKSKSGSDVRHGGFVETRMDYWNLIRQLQGYECRPPPPPPPPTQDGSEGCP